VLTKVRVPSPRPKSIDPEDGPVLAVGIATTTVMTKMLEQGATGESGFQGGGHVGVKIIVVAFLPCWVFSGIALSGSARFRRAPYLGVRRQSRSLLVLRRGRGLFGLP